MPSACGVSWTGTKGGKLDRSGIPDPPEHKSHFLNAAETKTESSFPVVDGDGNLRAGNVNSAWDLRNRGEGVSEDCLRKLDGAFDRRVLPDSAYENSMKLDEYYDGNGEFAINVEFETHPNLALQRDGFNKHGVRINDDGSVDARFLAMEPGIRRGAKITAEFLDSVAENATERVPVQLDHSKSQLANVGFIKPNNVKFGGNFLQLQPHFPDTGNSKRKDVLSDFKHDPPQVQDISVGFDPRSIELDTSGVEDNKPPRFVNGQLREVSLTPFPAGYDHGGLTPEFSEAVEKALSHCDDGEDCGCGCGPDSSPDVVESALSTESHTLIERKT